jgi:hypothetical protein
VISGTGREHSEYLSSAANPGNAVRITVYEVDDRFCVLVVRVPAYRFRSPRFDSRRYRIFLEEVSLERGPLSLVRIIEELLERKNRGSGL